MKLYGGRKSTLSENAFKNIYRSQLILSDMMRYFMLSQTNSSGQTTEETMRIAQERVFVGYASLAQYDKLGIGLNMIKALREGHLADRASVVIGRQVFFVPNQAILDDLELFFDHE